MITAKILADSVNPRGRRLTSFLLTYPRFIHSEIMTHRCFSRNAASSRAIPLKKMLADIEAEPALPERWGAEQKGMQSGDELPENYKHAVREYWKAAMDECIYFARGCGIDGLHKSLCNRLIEPWAHITVLVTATDQGLENFFALRAHPAAMPEFQVLAYRMLDLYIKNVPRRLGWRDWHIPKFGNMDGIATEDILKVATARCARLSYLTFDGEHSPEKDVELHDRLAEAGHWSPFEHCAQAVEYQESVSNFDLISHVRDAIEDEEQWENFSGWEQYRKRFKGECKRADLHQIAAGKPEWITLP